MPAAELATVTVEVAWNGVRVNGTVTLLPSTTVAVVAAGVIAVAGTVGVLVAKTTAFANKDVREMDKDLEVSEMIGSRTYSIPWFKKFDKPVIEQYANAVKKVCENYKELLAEDPGNPPRLGGWHFFNHSAKKAK